MIETERIVALSIVLIPLGVLWILVLFDIVATRNGLSIGWKGIWSAIVILIPYIGVFVYAFVRSPVQRRRSDRGDPTVIAQAIGQLHRLVREHDDGSITDDQFATKKAAVFGLDGP